MLRREAAGAFNGVKPQNCLLSKIIITYIPPPPPGIPSPIVCTPPNRYSNSFRYPAPGATRKRSLSGSGQIERGETISRVSCKALCPAIYRYYDEGVGSEGWILDLAEKKNVFDTSGRANVYLFTHS